MPGAKREEADKNDDQKADEKDEKADEKADDEKEAEQLSGTTRTPEAGCSAEHGAQPHNHSTAQASGSRGPALATLAEAGYVPSPLGR